MSKVILDDSHNIKEIEVDGSWIKDLTREYFEYRKKWELASQHYLFDFPLFLELGVSYACNYQCPKCPRQALQHTEKSGFLSDELLNKLFKEVKIYRMPSITFSYAGEPLMRKDLPQLIRKARDAFILDRMFHTNGSLLTRELSFDLIESGLTKINFSIDAASPETYRKVRVGGKYEKVIANIDEFLDIKKKIGKSYPRVRVAFVVTDENKHEQRRFYDLWKNKVNVISFQRHYDFTKMLKSDSYELEDCSTIEHCCSRLWHFLTITYKGDILVCELDYKQERVLGNLKTHTIYECWHSDMMNKLRELHLQNRWHKIPICRRCINSVERGKLEI